MHMGLGTMEFHVCPASKTCATVHLRIQFLSQTGRLAMRSALGAVIVAASALFVPTRAEAACTVIGLTVQCGNTSTTDTAFPANSPDDRSYQGTQASQIQLNTNAGSTIQGFGLAITNLGAGGIAVANGGTISVDAGNTPTAGGTAALSLTAAGGPLSYTGSGAVINNGIGNAFDVTQNGVGTININGSGAITAANGNGIYVRDTAAGGNIDVTTGAVMALAPGRNGIMVSSLSGAGNVTIVANGDVKAGNTGIVASLLNSSTGNIDITANGAIDARFGVEAQNFGTSGSTTVKTVGPVTATTGNGIFASTAGGAVSVTSGAVTSTGNTAIIAQQNSASSARVVGVTTNGAVSGTTGIDVLNVGIGATNLIANSTVTGTVGEGIKATTNGAVSVQVAGTVTGATNGLVLTGGVSGMGNISVTGTGGFVGGTGDAANVKNSGSGTVTINVSGAISSASANGLYVRDTTAGGDISVTTGAVTALAPGRNGIMVPSLSATGNVTIVANGDVKAGNTGIVGSLFNTSTGNIGITANGAIDARIGVEAQNFGTSGSTTVKTVGPVTATTGNGIFASTAGGAVSVTTGAVTSTGNTAIIARQNSASSGSVVAVTTNGAVSGTTGIDVLNNGIGAINLIANSTVTGTAGEGIKATGNDAVSVQVAGLVTGATNGLTLIGGGTGGAISVTGTGGFAGGTGDAANIFDKGLGSTVTVNVSGASSSTGGDGIVVRDTAVGGGISVSTGAVTAFMNGINVVSLSTAGDVTIVTNGDVKAGFHGIFGVNGSSGSVGNLAVTANGAVDGQIGVYARNLGAGSTTVKTVGPVNAGVGYGVYAATNGGGGVSVTTGDVTSTGSAAIAAFQTSAAGIGTVRVTVNGAVSGTTGIEAINSGIGAISVTANGTVTGLSAEGIKATGNGAVGVQVTGLVTGATRAITAAGGSGAINISSGTIRNASGLTTDEAIRTSGGPFTLANAGTIVGTASFGAAADTFINSGAWRTAGGSSDFGGGGDTLRNTPFGVLDVAGVGAPATTTFDNLALFVNQGRLTLINGLAGDLIRTSGNVQFAGGSVYAIDINAAGQSDRLVAQGTVQLAGTLAVKLNAAAPGTHYTVLTAAGGVSGHFDAVAGGTAFLLLRDTYDANNAYLDIAKRAFAQAGVTANQIATANGLDSLPVSEPLYNAVLGLATDAQARHAFDQLSGEVHASARTALIEDSRFVREAATNRVRAAFGSVGASRAPVMAFADPVSAGPAMAYAALDPTTTTSVAVAPTTDRFVLWSQGFGSWGRTGGDGNAARLNRATGGFLIGGDAPIFEIWRLGAMAGYSRTSFNVRERSSAGASDNYHLGLYGGTTWTVAGGNLGFRTGAAYTWHDIATSRSIAFAGFGDSLKADYRAGTAQVFGEFGYGFRAGRLSFEPFANLAYVNLGTNGLAERGGAAALRGANSTTGVTFATLGVHAAAGVDLGAATATLRGMVGWRHAFGNTTPFATFAFAGGSPFTIAGVPIARDAFVFDAGIDIAIARHATLGISYGGQFGARATEQSVRGNFSVKF